MMMSHKMYENAENLQDYDFKNKTVQLRLIIFQTEKPL